MNSQEFIEKDFYDSLRWLFVAAVKWEASKDESGNHDPIAMFAAFLQARALYEFFFASGTKDDARAACFAPQWHVNETDLYKQYMAAGRPANKRMFHLVCNRSGHSGGSGHDGPDHLKNQVLNVAKEIAAVTKQFASKAADKYKRGILSALTKALSEAEQAAKSCGIANQFSGES